MEGILRLTSADLPQISPALHAHFREVTDHIRTLQEKIDALREVLAFAFEASVLVGQARKPQSPRPRTDNHICEVLW